MANKTLKWTQKACGFSVHLAQRYMPKIMKLSFIFLIVILFSHSLYAQDYMPYPTADISISDWQNYYQTVSEEHIATERRHPVQKLVTYADEKQSLQFAFTLEGHPAHPCWITRQVIEENGTISLNQIGYFAGSEEEFAKLFNVYEQMNEKVRVTFRK